MTVKRSPLGCAGAAVIVAMIVAAALPFVLPVVAPQASCDLLAPILGCKGGAAPTCGLQSHMSRRGRSGSSVVVVCPEGGGSAAPIYILAGSIMVLSLGAGAHGGDATGGDQVTGGGEGLRGRADAVWHPR